MRSLLLVLALGGCASAVPHPAADPANAGKSPDYRPLAETAPAPADMPPLGWRQVNDEMRSLGGHAGATGDAAGHKH